MNWWLYITFALICLIIGLIIESKNDIFLFLFHYNTWKAWYDEIANACDYRLGDIVHGNYRFHNGMKIAIVWNEDNDTIGGLCSVSDFDGRCLLSTYYKKPSRRMAKKLLKKLDKGEN